MSQRPFWINAVTVAAPLAFSLENASGLEFGDNLVNGAFGDANGGGDVAQAHVGISSQTDEDVSVIGEESPMMCWGVGIFFHFEV